MEEVEEEEGWSIKMVVAIVAAVVILVLLVAVVEVAVVVAVVIAVVVLAAVVVVVEELEKNFFNGIGTDFWFTISRYENDCALLIVQSLDFSSPDTIYL